jgi:heme exporter protein CcmD
MDGVQTFLAMGGYGSFVWSAYGLSALGLVVLTAASLASLRQRERQLRIYEAANDASSSINPKSQL